MISRFSSYIDARPLVLGASGFIGRWVARALCAAGARPTLVVRRPESAALFAAYDVDGQTRVADLGDPDAAARVVASTRPGVVFNLAGYGVDRSERDEATAYRINRDLPAALCAALADVPAGDWSGARLVHVGSALEYGETTGDLREDGDVDPTTLYGQSKLAGTRAVADGCATHGLRGLTARLFTIYGPGEHDGRLLPSLLEAARGEQPLPLTAGAQQRDFTYVADVAEGLLRLGLADGATAPGEVVNLATGTLTSVRGFVETAAAVLGIAAERLAFGALPTRAEEMAHEPVTIARLRARTGWAPTTTIADGVRATAAFEAAPLEAPAR